MHKSRQKDKWARGAVVTAAMGLGLAFTLSNGAAAQTYDRGRNITDIGGETGAYRAVGMPAGAFTLYPRLDLALNYSDNIYAVEENKESGVYASIAPSVRAVSGWGRHSLSAEGGLRLRRYFDQSSENQNGWFARTQGRLDVHGRSYLTAMGEIARTYEQRQSAQSPAFAAEPIPIIASTAQLRGVHELNRMRLSAGVAYRGLDYKDVPDNAGNIIDLDVRDRTQLAGDVKVEYGVSPDTAVFIQGITQEIDYENSLPGFFARDSQQQTVLVGANFDITELMRGEIGVGYTNREYDQAGLGQIKGFAVTGTVEYFPTRFTTVRLDLSRRAEDAIDLQGGGFFLSSAALQVDHELRHNVILNAAGEYADENYERIDRHDKVMSFAVGATYIVNRMLRTNVSAGHVRRNSDGLARYSDFSENRITVGLTLQR